MKNQTYKNVRHIVSYDNEEDLPYLKELDIDLLFVKKKKAQFEKSNENGDISAPYNLYCNKLLDTVDEGWILFLDDDDNLYHNKVLQEIINLIDKENSNDRLFIWQMRYPNGKLLPTNKMIDNELVRKNNIGSPCFLFHTKYKDKVRWDEFKASDFRFLESLVKIIPKKIFVKKVVVQLNNFGGIGKRNDVYLNTRKVLGPYFNKNLFWYFIPKKHFELFGFPVFQNKSYASIQKKAQKFPRRILNFIKSKK